MRGRCVIMTRRHCGACKLKMPKSKCPKCFVSFFDFQLYHLFQFPSAQKQVKTNKKIGGRKQKKGAENKQKMEICPPAFKWHAASWQPAIQQANTHENGMKTVRKRKKWFRALVAHFEAQRGGGRLGWKWKQKMDMEIDFVFLFVFIAFWHPDRNRKNEKKHFQNQLRP